MQTSSTSPERMRILVVDDDRDTTDSAVILLKGAGYEAIGAYDAEHAMKISGLMPPRVVLLDLAMPYMDGYHLARQLRRLPGMERAVLICVSGLGTAADRQQSRDAGCFYHILKPVDWDELLAILRLIATSDDDLREESLGPSAASAAGPVSLPL